MKTQTISIATARINGLTASPYYFEAKCFWAWKIMFSDTSTLGFFNLPFIKVGDNEEEAVIFCNRLKNKFKQANIHDGDKVAVIFGEDGNARAIGRTGTDLWIDVDDKFVIKTFKELNINIKSLKVY